MKQLTFLLSTAFLQAHFDNVGKLFLFFDRCEETAAMLGDEFSVYFGTATVEGESEEMTQFVQWAIEVWRGRRDQRVMRGWRQDAAIHGYVLQGLKGHHVFRFGERFRTGVALDQAGN